MGDRTTPMKFGPEWLRNLSREPTSPSSSGASGSNQSMPPLRPVTSIATGSSNTSTPPNTSKVLLAKLRYGREEMLALYDRQTADAPPQLRSIDLLYQPRGKPPYALNNNFEDDTRDSNMRNNPPSVGVLSLSDRYGQGRGRGINLTDGRGRATTISESRGRARGFVRQTSLGRSPNWHNGQRTYPGTPDDDPNPPRGLWNNGNGMNPPGIRPNVEQPEWATKAPFRKNRQNHTNWRQQPNRDEGEEWRSSEGARRGQEKWEREWPERNNQDKPWNSNRRQWSGDNNEDSLPEWAVENSEACGGTFDSSGAFHGYSNDDSNLPRTQEAASYPLARSHTHGSFARSRTAEEGSEEWWASEKTKKLSAKRFDATEVKFKKHVTPGISEENASGNTSAPLTDTGANTNTGPTSNTGPTTSTGSNTNTGQNKTKIELLRRSASPPTHDYGQELQDEAAALPVKREQEQKQDEDQIKDRTYYSDNTPSSVQQRIDMLLRTEEPESSNERGNYKSVMMNSNNNHLRQKHQNIGMPTNDPPKRVVAPLFERAKQQAMQNQSDEETQQKQQETKLVEDLLDMNLNDELQAHLLNATTQATGVTNQISSPSMQMRMNLLNQSMAMNQPNTNMPLSPGMPQGSMMRPMGITNSMLNASLGLPLTGPNMGMPPMPSMTPSISNQGMLSSGLQGLGGNNLQNAIHGGMQQSGMQAGMQQSGLQAGMQQSGMQAGMQQSGMQAGMQQSGLQAGMQQSGMQPGMQQSGMQTGMQQSGLQAGMQQSGMQPGMQQSGMQMQGAMQGMPGNGYQPVGGMPGNMQPGGIASTNLQSVSGMPGFQGIGNSLFMQASSANMQNPNEMVMHSQQAMYPMHGHGLQQSTSHGSFNPATMYGNMMQQPPSGPLPNIPLTEQWYYEDPKKTIQGPFTSKEMCNWYRAGFFNPDLMVRRACESGLRPLANYGIMPFGPMDMLPPPYNQMAGRFDMRQAHENMMNAQQAGLGPEVESLWSQPTANDLMWMQQAAQARDDNSRVNNLSMYFWDQSSGMSNSLLPEAITKEMKTEDEILAQMRASQGDPASQNLTFMSDTVSPEDAFTAGTNIAPNLEELQKLIESDIHVNAAQRATAAVAADSAADATAPAPADSTLQHPHLAAAAAAADKDKKTDNTEPILEMSAKQPTPPKSVETKPVKQPAKVEEKPAKAKEVVATTKTEKKAKKQKEEKKDDAAEVKSTTEEKKSAEKRSEEPSPPKNKKEDKANKKDLDKEKKEWLKDGFTIVKGTEKKDNKKKEREEARAAEEAEKKKKEEEKRALIEAEKNRAPEPVTRKQQMEIGQVRQPHTQAQAEPAPKKAPWSAPAAGRDGLALSDIQRLEREKKLEQMKEQQHMMQVIAQQQAASAAALKEQELQAGQLGWAKKKQSNNSPPGQTLAEIQAEARLQAASVAAAASAAAREEARATPPPVNVIPWGSTNGGGFWDSPSSTASASCTTEPKAAETARVTETKPKKRVTVVAPPKKETTPAADFETWCTSVLSNWRDAASIDIPTFIAFLRDIESPYEVKDYVKCYLGDTKESTDFSRHFLERRSRLLRVGMVTPSDDLCSPAAAINPRTNSGSDYTEVKSKGKKTKKNKMFKVDARILGFSVTASEDRINIGDIDMV